MDVSVIRMSMIKGKGVARCIAVASNLCLGGDDVDAIIKNMLVDAVGKSLLILAWLWLSFLQQGIVICTTYAASCR